MASPHSSAAAESMAEALLIRSSVEVSLHNIITSATQYINLLFGYPDDLHQKASSSNFLDNMMKNLFSHSSSHDDETADLVKAMRQELDKLKAVSLSKLQSVSILDHQEEADDDDQVVIIQLWIQELADLASDALDDLANFDYQFLQHEVPIQNQTKETKAGIPSSKIISKEFRDALLPQLKVLVSKLDDINQKVESFHVPPGLFAVDASQPQVMDEATRSGDYQLDFLIPDHTSLVGRAPDSSKIVEMLSCTPRNEVLSVFSLVGPSGIGKTTLAQSVCSDQRVLKRFDRIAWVNVGSAASTIKGLLKLILESLTGKQVAGDQSIKKMVSHLAEELGKDRFLLVLDDILKTKQEKWEDFKHKLMDISIVRGNAILVITPNEQDAAAMFSTVNSHSLAKLSPEHCLSIIKDKVNAVGPEADSMELEHIGKQIAEKCQGLPLAANLLGGLLLQCRGKQFWAWILERGILDDAENVVSQILKLIFEYLPSPFLRRCFVFTSMLPRNSDIERMQLVQLWMAEGFIEPEKMISSRTLEEVGDQYFEMLLRFYLLEPVKKDKYSNKITHCKMHTLVHDFASSISRFETFNCDASGRNRNSDDDAEAPPIRHLKLESWGKQHEKMVEENGQHLKTLFLNMSNIPEDVLQLEFNRLHVLNLSGADIEELPSFIDELTQLEYLDISRTNLKSLPDSICSLYKLQTLRIFECSNSFEEFPQDFKNLVSLRHLHLSTEKNFKMPREIGRLTNLQTLPVYNVGETMGFGIGELNSLKNLRGKLVIYNLDYVGDKKEAEQADLCGKSHLQELQLHWPRSGIRTKDMVALPYDEITGIKITVPNPKDEDVLDGLQPHPNLKSLVLENFWGERFPSWLMNMSVSAGGSQSKLNNLVEVKLTKCNRLQELPTLGLLPLLRDLELGDLPQVTMIGNSFYHGTEGCDGDSETGPYFPALKSLTLDSLSSVKGWMGIEETSASDGVGVFPELESLSVRNCYDLKSAPSHFPSLKKLHIETIGSTSALENICSKSTSLTNLHIQNVVGLTCLPHALLQNNPNLSRLHIENCSSLTHIVSSDMSSWSNLSSLQELVIRDCDSLEELPAALFESLQSLEKLEISQCPQLESLPTSFGQGGLTCLSSFVLSDCPKLPLVPEELWKIQTLDHLKIGLFPYDDDDDDDDDDYDDDDDEDGDDDDDDDAAASGTSMLAGLEKFTSLCSLDIGGNNEWDCLPKEIQHLTALKQLTLQCFSIESLPDWMEKLSSLQELNLISCLRLQSYPSKDTMRGLKKLRKLTIKESPDEEESC